MNLFKKIIEKLKNLFNKKQEIVMLEEGRVDLNNEKDKFRESLKVKIEKITKSRNLQGTIEIEGMPVVQLSASITIDPSDFTIYNNGGVNRTILNTDLYRKNISTIRQEIAEFEEEVYLMEDEMLAASKVELEE